MAENVWSVPLQELANRVGLDVKTVARKATFDLFRAVKLRSPVLTGRFRANWNVSYGTADLTVTKSTRASRIDGQIKKVLTLPVGGVIYMSNGLPYAEGLEYGKSKKKAPQGMVRISAIEFNDYVRRVLSS